MPSTIRQNYQQFQQSLQVLQLKLTNSDVVSGTLQSEMAQLQLQFQQISLSLHDLEQSQANLQIEAIQTEISKQLRLIQTDLVFLKAARQPATVEQRQQQMQTRLEQLLNYCSAALAIWDQENS
jgi:hypothetical protein